MSIFICKFCGSERKNANAKSNHEVYCKENPNRKIAKGSPGKRNEFSRSITIETDELCSYGCNQVAKFKNKSGKIMCSRSSNSCPMNRKKNSKGIKKAHEEGRIPKYNEFPDESKERMTWAKGLTAEIDERVHRHTEESKEKISKSNRGRTLSEEHKKKISESRLKYLLQNNYDTSGRKGHRGYYDGFFFHSSWELAFYIWNKEVKNHIMQKNTSHMIEYMVDNKIKRYIPDFIDEEGNFHEIKGYLYSRIDNKKYEQTKNKVRYWFHEDLKECLKYLTDNYGSNFWVNFFNADMGK